MPSVPVPVNNVQQLCLLHGIAAPAAVAHAGAAGGHLVPSMGARVQRGGLRIVCAWHFHLHLRQHTAAQYRMVPRSYVSGHNDAVCSSCSAGTACWGHDTGCALQPHSHAWHIAPGAPRVGSL